MVAAQAVRRVDQANVGLVIISLVLAIYFPYRGMLLAYAILGPLHYLTELNWLHGRQFFVQERRWLWVALALTLAIVLPKLGLPNYPTAQHLPQGLNHALAWVNGYTDGFILMAFLLSISFVFTQKRSHRLAVVGLGLVATLLLKNVPFHQLFTGFLLPSLIHVYLFTLLFMYFGTRKSGSRWGLVALALAVLAPVFIIFFDPLAIPYAVPAWAQAHFADNGFHSMNAGLGMVINVTDGTRFYWYEAVFLRLQIFITFAYLYHYLNWFSKTSIIGWHKNLSRTRTAGILALWALLVALFAYNYRIGFFAALGFSFLHVLGEFPLNIVTLRTLLDRK